MASQGDHVAQGDSRPSAGESASAEQLRELLAEVRTISGAVAKLESKMASMISMSEAQATTHKRPKKLDLLHLPGEILNRIIEFVVCSNTPIRLNIVCKGRTSTTTYWSVDPKEPKFAAVSKSLRDIVRSIYYSENFFQFPADAHTIEYATEELKAWTRNLDRQVQHLRYLQIHTGHRRLASRTETGPIETDMEIKRDGTIVLRRQSRVTGGDSHQRAHLCACDLQHLVECLRSSEQDCKGAFLLAIAERCILKTAPRKEVDMCDRCERCESCQLLRLVTTSLA